MSERTASTSAGSPGTPPTPEFPGLLTTTDGTNAVVWVETHIGQGACAYPITPSTNMGVNYAQAVANGMHNLWDEPLRFIEPESEHSSASAAEGFALAGGRVSNFTSGQGLILMKEVLYVISGKRLPIVFNIGARALTSHALNVHAGHDDVMGVADVGWGMLFARNAQESADLALICRKVAEQTETPFLNIQDGFLTTHTVESVRLPEEELMKRFIGKPSDTLHALLDPARGIMSGTVQNQDAYMRGKIAQRGFTDRIPASLEAAMTEYGELTGRKYGLVTGYRMADADFAIVALGSTAETAEAAVDWLRTERGLRVGVVHPTVFRPFPGPELVELLKNVQGLAVIERMDNPMGQSNPLTTEVKAAFCDALTGREGYPVIHRVPEILSGAAGLGSRDVRPGDIIAVAEALADPSKTAARSFFSLNVDHSSALKAKVHPDVRPPGAFSLRGYSIGGFGSVTTNKLIADVSADLFELFVQAYPKYGSEKKGLPTEYYLTLAQEPIRTHCEMEQAEFIPLNNVHAMELGNPFTGLSQGGLVFVQWPHEDAESLWARVPAHARHSLNQSHGRMFYLDAAAIAREEASRQDLEIRMQGIVLLGVFLRVTPFAANMGLDEKTLFARVEQALRKAFGKVSEKVVQENLRCVQRGYREVRELPQHWIEEAGEARAQASSRTVAEVMHHGVVTCAPEDELTLVATTLKEKHISAVVVVDQQERLAGVLSTTDLAKAGEHAQLHVSQRRALPTLKAKHLMTRDVIVTWPEEPLSAALDKLMVFHIHRLVVVKSEAEQDLPVGILSVTDLAAQAAP